MVTAIAETPKRTSVIIEKSPNDVKCSMRIPKKEIGGPGKMGKTQPINPKTNNAIPSIKKSTSITMSNQ